MSAIWFHILIGGSIGTTVMTLFTYWIESITGKDLGEPKYLNRLIRYSRRFEAETGDGHMAGWAIHYFIGVLFAAAMIAFRSITGIDLTPLVGMFIGAIFGLLGIVGWTVMFAVHDDPPQIKFPIFLVQLVVVHILFGATVTLYFRIMGI
jgi:hypothetical protein